MPSACEQAIKAGAGDTAHGVKNDMAAALGADIPAGTWHTSFALVPDAVILEARAGPPSPADRRRTRTLGAGRKYARGGSVSGWFAGGVRCVAESARYQSPERGHFGGAGRMQRVGGVGNAAMRWFCIEPLDNLQIGGINHRQQFFA